MDDLTKDQKQVVAKTLFDLNVSAQEVADTLGVNRSTVYRYSEKPVPAELRQFATEMKVIFSLKQQQIMAKILKNIEEVIGSTDDIRGLVGAYEVLKRHTQSVYEIKRQAALEEDHVKLYGEKQI
jgi:predicted transcriptional regulator